MIEPEKFSVAARVLSLKMTGQVGPRTFNMLMAIYHKVDNILFVEEEELIELSGIGPSRSKAIAGAHNNLENAEKIIDGLRAGDTGVVCCLDDDYPAMLHDLNDPPLLLYYKGKLPGNDEKRVAIIGSQDVSETGIGDVVELSRHLAEEKIAIVGGLARGIDTAGHVGALKTDEATYAVLPSGFDNIYPSENEQLCREISATGGLISEYLPDTRANTGRLMSRNRIIVGLSNAIVIGEVSASSVGTLDAALCCHQLGKLMFVIVGKNNHHYEKLLEYGGIPLTNIEEYKIILKSLV